MCLPRNTRPRHALNQRGYVVVENVPGILRKKEESGLNEFIEWLKENGYTNPHFKVHNVNNYGVPQSRKRFTLIASRLTKDEIQPIEIEGERLTVKDILGEENGFPKIEDGHKDLTTFYHSVPSINDTNKKRLKKVAKNGGDKKFLLYRLEYALGINARNR